MSYETLFHRYGSPSKKAEIKITAYLIRPDTLTADRIPYNDQSAARVIAQCQATIEALTKYRQALAERYAALATAAYKERLEIERQPSCYDGIRYYVRIVRTYEDGTTEHLLSETFPGKERWKALSRFEELRKQRPGIEAVQDIARRSWER